MGTYLYDVNIRKDTVLTIKIYPDGRATCDDGKYLTHVIIAEIPDIVTCAECKYWEVSEDMGIGHCVKHRSFNQNFYCADGEEGERLDE